MFAESYRLSLDDSMTIEDFIELTKNAYGGSIIQELSKAYGINN